MRPPRTRRVASRATALCCAVYAAAAQQAAGPAAELLVRQCEPAADGATEAEVVVHAQVQGGSDLLAQLDLQGPAAGSALCDPALQPEPGWHKPGSVVAVTRLPATMSQAIAAGAWDPEEMKLFLGRTGTVARWAGNGIVVVDFSPSVDGSKRHEVPVAALLPTRTVAGSTQWRLNPAPDAVWSAPCAGASGIRNCVEQLVLPHCGAPPAEGELIGPEMFTLASPCLVFRSRGELQRGEGDLAKLRLIPATGNGHLGPVVIRLIRGGDGGAPATADSPAPGATFTHCPVGRWCAAAVAPDSAAAGQVAYVGAPLGLPGCEVRAPANAALHEVYTEMQRPGMAPTGMTFCRSQLGAQALDVAAGPVPLGSAMEAGSGLLAVAAVHCTAPGTVTVPFRIGNGSHGVWLNATLQVAAAHPPVCSGAELRAEGSGSLSNTVDLLDVIAPSDWQDTVSHCLMVWFDPAAAAAALRPLGTIEICNGDEEVCRDPQEWHRLNFKQPTLRASGLLRLATREGAAGAATVNFGGIDGDDLCPKEAKLRFVVESREPVMWVDNQIDFPLAPTQPNRTYLIEVGAYEPSGAIIEGIRVVDIPDSMQGQLFLIGSGSTALTERANESDPIEYGLSHTCSSLRRDSLSDESPCWEGIGAPINVTTTVPVLVPPSNKLAEEGEERGKFAWARFLYAPAEPLEGTVQFAVAVVTADARNRTRVGGAVNITVSVRAPQDCWSAPAQYTSIGPTGQEMAQVKLSDVPKASIEVTFPRGTLDTCVLLGEPDVASYEDMFHMIGDVLSFNVSKDCEVPMFRLQYRLEHSDAVCTVDVRRQRPPRVTFLPGSLRVAPGGNASATVYATSELIEDLALGLALNVTSLPLGVSVYVNDRLQREVAEAGFPPVSANSSAAEWTLRVEVPAGYAGGFKLHSENRTCSSAYSLQVAPNSASAARYTDGDCQALCSQNPSCAYVARYAVQGKCETFTNCSSTEELPGTLLFARESGPPPAISLVVYENRDSPIDGALSSPPATLPLVVSPQQDEPATASPATDTPAGAPERTPAPVPTTTPDDNNAVYGSYGAQYAWGTAQPQYKPDATQPSSAPDAAQPQYSPDATQPSSAPDAAQPQYSSDATQPSSAPDATQPQYSSDATQPSSAPAAPGLESTPAPGAAYAGAYEGITTPSLAPAAGAASATPEATPAPPAGAQPSPSVAPGHATSPPVRFDGYNDFDYDRSWETGAPQPSEGGVTKPPAPEWTDPPIPKSHGYDRGTPAPNRWSEDTPAPHAPSTPMPPWTPSPDDDLYGSGKYATGTASGGFGSMLLFVIVLVVCLAAYFNRESIKSSLPCFQSRYGHVGGGEDDDAAEMTAEPGEVRIGGRPSPSPRDDAALLPDEQMSPHRRPPEPQRAVPPPRPAAGGKQKVDVVARDDDDDAWDDWDDNRGETASPARPAVRHAPQERGLGRIAPAKRQQKSD
eukprot:TRINITY_DN10527_c0_g1_i1.p1 TRINITY_DN10527_c0_g1~~TRINITY_DN10527_c0_g1_i1.p1  ORF type:complete len:1487 (+),score=330.21 TRINITY_DN10527_c0_g1_i1:91-4461(+)